MPANHIRWLHDLSQEHNDAVGKKCANLGELARLGMQVPPGFAISVDAHRRYMDLTGLGRRIADYFAPFGDDLKRSFSAQIEASRRVQEMIRAAPMPPEVGDEIGEGYELLCERCRTANVPVAVRSSGAVSMPGQMDTYLHVRGGTEVKRRVLDVWESAFNTRAIAFRLERGMDVHRAPIGVGVIKMVDAKSAGVVLSIDPITGVTDRAVIEGNWGLGESVVSGAMTPDHFVVMKATGVIDRRIGRKARWVVPSGEGTAIADVPAELQDAPCLTDEEIRELVRVAVGVERHFGVPQDLEWAVDRSLPFPESVFWVQARPARHRQQPRSAEIDYLIEQMVRLFRC